MISTLRNASEHVQRPPPRRAKPVADIVGSMTPMMKFGKLTHARGCCPVCGHEVDLRQSFNGIRLAESYGCYRCGPTTYVSAQA